MAICHQYPEVESDSHTVIFLEWIILHTFNVFHLPLRLNKWTPWDHPPSRGPRTSLVRLWSLNTKAATTVTGAMVRNFTIEELNSQCHDFEGQTTSSDVLTASFRLSDHPVAVSSGQNLPWKNRTQSLVISSWFPITIEKTNKGDIYHRFLGEVYAGKTNLSPELTLVSLITFSCIKATLLMWSTFSCSLVETQWFSVLV